MGRLSPCSVARQALMEFWLSFTQRIGFLDSHIPFKRAHTLEIMKDGGLVTEDLLYRCTNTMEIRGCTNIRQFYVSNSISMFGFYVAIEGPIDWGACSAA